MCLKAAWPPSAVIVIPSCPPCIYRDSLLFSAIQVLVGLLKDLPLSQGPRVSVASSSSSVMRMPCAGCLRCSSRKLVSPGISAGQAHFPCLIGALSSNKGPMAFSTVHGVGIQSYMS